MIPILRYMSLDSQPPQGSRHRPVSLATFTRHCHLIAASGRQPMTVSGYAASLRAGAPPGSPVVITFDDGGVDTLNAIRRLAGDGLTATVFITSSRVGTPGYFNRADLHRMRGLGIEIGGSGHTGRRLDELARTDVIAELTLSRRCLAAVTGDEPRAFAYPRGGYDMSLRQLVISAGYTSACAVRDALSHPADDRFALARLTVEASTPESRLVAWLAGVGRPEPHPVALRARAYRLRRAVRSTGPIVPRLGRADPGPASGTDSNGSPSPADSDLGTSRRPLPERQPLPEHRSLPER